jgi:2-furoyl-CoA dehydrogenase large subunit
VCAQVAADELGCAPEDVTVLSELDTQTTPWTVASGNYSSRFSGVGVGAVQLAARRVRAKLDAIREHAGDPELPLRKVAGMAHWNPEGLPDGMEPGLAAVAFRAAPNLDPPDAEDRVASSGAHGFIVDVCAVEIDPDTGEVEVLDYVTVHDAGVLLNPLLADGQVVGGLAHGAAAALFERHVYDESGNLMTGSLVDYLTPTAPDLPVPRIGHLSSPSPFTPLGAKGLGEGNTMSAPVAIANAVADALGRDDVELPLTAPRVWELLQRGDG